MALAPTATDAHGFRREVLACAANSTVGAEECVRLHIDDVKRQLLTTATRDGRDSATHRTAIERFKGAVLALRDVRHGR